MSNLTARRSLETTFLDFWRNYDPDKLDRKEEIHCVKRKHNFFARLSGLFLMFIRGAQEMLDPHSLSYSESTPNYIAPITPRTSSMILLTQTPRVLGLLRTLYTTHSRISTSMQSTQALAACRITSQLCITIAQTSTDSSFRLCLLDDLLNMKPSSSTSAWLRLSFGFSRLKNHCEEPPPD